MNKNDNQKVNINKNIQNNMSNKALPDVFKELEKIKNQQIQEQINEKQHSKGKKKKTNNITKNKSILDKNIKQRNTKNTPKFRIKDVFLERDPLSIVMCTAVALLGITMLSSNYIFAKEDESNIENTPKQIVGTYEKNNDAINLQQVLTDNINTTETKELLTMQRQVDFQTEYYENAKLPKDEQVVTQEGVLGTEEVSYIRTYANSSVMNDTIIGIQTLENPITQKIDVGTNEFLAEQKIHIDDLIYAKDQTTLYKEMNESSEVIGIIVKYYDVKLLDIEGDWCKVQIFDYIGYAKKDNFVSANTSPDIVDKCRRQKVVINVNENMNMNEKTGLTLDDYKEIFSNNSRDTRKIFEQNAETFYNVEQKYNINGLFVASIGIHESAWGNSTIAQNKNNLFGYGSYDSDPYNMSFSFDTYSKGIETVAQVLVKYYLNPFGTDIYDGQKAIGSYYNGNTIKAVNTRYASDPDWNVKVFNTMKSLYNKIAP